MQKLGKNVFTRKKAKKLFVSQHSYTQVHFLPAFLLSEFRFFSYVEDNRKRAQAYFLFGILCSSAKRHGWRKTIGTQHCLRLFSVEAAIIMCLRKFVPSQITIGNCQGIAKPCAMYEGQQEISNCCYTASAGAATMSTHKFAWTILLGSAKNGSIGWAKFLFFGAIPFSDVLFLSNVSSHPLSSI